jgi:4-hydroxybenzoate polyprenyltransferase
MINYLKLIRPKDWAKNLFIFVPAFFAGSLFNLSTIGTLIYAFFAFCFFASSIYILNDYKDMEEDRLHPVKRNRPMASGKIDIGSGIILCVCLILSGTLLGYAADKSLEFLFILGIYFMLNLFYTLGLKNIAILDIIIVAAGFVLRVKGGAIVTNVDSSEWLIIMTFLISLFMAIAKRRDDMLIKISTGAPMRKALTGYNLEFLNIMLGLFSAIIIVAYINYTVSPATIARLGTYRLYYSSLFVIAGIMRYLQISFVQGDAGSPVEVFYKDRFIQITILLWIFCIYILIYLKDVTIFKK